MLWKFCPISLVLDFQKQTLKLPDKLKPQQKNRFTTGWGPQDSVNSWFISDLTMVFGRYNELVNGGQKFG